MLLIEIKFQGLRSEIRHGLYTVLFSLQLHKLQRMSDRIKKNSSFDQLIGTLVI